MQCRGHPTTEDQLCPYGDGADEGGHKEAGGKEAISQNTYTHIASKQSRRNNLCMNSVSHVFRTDFDKCFSVEAAGPRTAEREKNELNTVKAEEVFLSHWGTLISSLVNLLSV